MSVRQLQAEIERDRAALKRATRSYRTRDGRELRIARLGSGTPVLCVPSVPEVDFVYMPQIEHLAQRHEVAIYEPQLSRSRRVGLAERQAELEAVIDALGGGPVHLLAWSDAGSYASRAVRNRPEVFRSLALLGLPDKYVLARPLQAYAELLYRRPIERTVPGFVVSALLARYLGGPKFSRRWVFGEAQRIERSPEYLKHSILPMILDHQADDVPVRVPSVLIGGDHDALVPVDRMRRMTALLGPKVPFVEIPGGEHMLGYVSRQPVNDALDRFYASVEAAASAPVDGPR